MFAIYTFCCLLMILKTLTLLHRIAYTQSDILISNSGLLKLFLLLNVIVLQRKHILQLVMFLYGDQNFDQLGRFSYYKNKEVAGM